MTNHPNRSKRYTVHVIESGHLDAWTPGKILLRTDSAAEAMAAADEHGPFYTFGTVIRDSQERTLDFGDRIESY